MMPALSRRLVLLGALATVACTSPRPSDRPREVEGWSSEEVWHLATAPDLELLVVDPMGPLTAGPGERLRGHLVLGQTAINDPVDARRLLVSFDHALRNPTMPAACFSPRHALRGTGPSGVVTALICFECAAVVFLADGKARGGGLDAAGGHVFEELRIAAGLPIAP